MNNLKNIFIFFSLTIVIYLLFKYNYVLSNSVLSATEIWLKNVFPGIFCMIILNDIIINLNLVNNLNNIIKKIFNKIFKISGTSSICFILSIISGTPTSTYIIKEMYLNNLLSLNDANKLISFTYFSNPLFLYNILSINFDSSTTFKIIFIHYISNIFIGIIFRNKYKYIEYNTNISYKNDNLFSIISTSVKKSIDTLLMILGSIIFYMIISNILITILPLNNNLMVLLKGLLEITQGLNNISLINNPYLKEIIALSIISFGGLSIHTQVKSILNGTKILYKNFLLGRILHTIISLTIFIICTIISNTPCFSRIS